MLGVRLLLIGAPGAGKGTQATRIADHFHVAHISSGDLLRAHVINNTAIGRTAQDYMERGDLVPDEVVLDMLRKPVTEAVAAGGYVLDGFPRTVEQAEAAYAVAKDLGVAVQVAVHLAVDPASLLERLVARGQESGRSDDTPEIIKHRIDVYEQRTKPLLDYYAERERLITVNGERPIDEVTWSVIVQLQKAQRLLAD
ncbi:MAG: adenylate kinase [Frankiaceae bacterium]|jgi:adenylate kinase|nr:adenylate kinase [Frankiaceae bacterium]